jgi:hypothetical protein
VEDAAVFQCGVVVELLDGVVLLEILLKFLLFFLGFRVYLEEVFVSLFVAFSPGFFGCVCKKCVSWVGIKFAFSL